MKITGLQETMNLCNCSVVKLSEVARTFGKVDFVKEMTVKKTCKYGKYDLFERMLCLFTPFDTGQGRKGKGHFNFKG